MITEKILEKVNNLPENTNGKIHELEQSISDNETNVSSLKNKVDKLYGDNENLNSNHMLKSYPGKYFSTIVDEKDLNNIKYNLICYTTTNDNLINLPNDETGGRGILEVIQTFTNSSSQHTIQRYTNTVTNISYIRSFNKDNEIWTNWDKINGGQKYKLTEDHGACKQVPDRDLNNISLTGYWMGDKLLNSPTPDWIYIESMVHNNLYQVQTATKLHDSSMRWTRHKTSGNWSEWREL